MIFYFNPNWQGFLMLLEGLDGGLNQPAFSTSSRTTVKTKINNSKSLFSIFIKKGFSILHLEVLIRIPSSSCFNLTSNCCRYSKIHGCPIIKWLYICHISDLSHSMSKSSLMSTHSNSNTTSMMSLMSSNSTGMMSLMSSYMSLMNSSSTSLMSLMSS